jgi:diadenylate cyclase
MDVLKEILDLFEINDLPSALVWFFQIFLVSLLLYSSYRLLKGTVAINIFIGIILIYFTWLITDFLNMELLSGIIEGFFSVGIIALIVVFQPEIRKFLLMIGSTNISTKGSIIEKMNFLKNQENIVTDITTIVNACQNMSESKTGALIIIERNNSLNFLLDTGDQMNISVTQPIIESIFFKNSPLHDGAVIIANNTIKATRVVLPINNDNQTPSRFGLRHKAAVGITDKTDALAIVVSEETGIISYIKNGDFVSYKNQDKLNELIKEDLN